MGRRRCLGRLVVQERFAPWELHRIQHDLGLHLGGRVGRHRHGENLVLHQLENEIGPRLLVPRESRAGVDSHFVLARQGTRLDFNHAGELAVATDHRQGPVLGVELVDPGGHLQGHLLERGFVVVDRFPDSRAAGLKQPLDAAGRPVRDAPGALQDLADASHLENAVDDVLLPLE